MQESTWHFLAVSGAAHAVLPVWANPFMLAAMSTLSTTALSGMKAAQVQLDVAAHNVANAQTPGFRRQQVTLTTQSEGGVEAQLQTSTEAVSSLETDLVGELQARNAFLANLAVFKTANRMAGVLLDEQA